MFPPPEAAAKRPPPCDTLSDIKFSLVFDDKIDGPLLSDYLQSLSQPNNTIIEINEEENSSGESDEEPNE